MTREEKLQQFAEQNTKGLHLDRHNLIQMVKQGAEWADQHPNWISVEDELPKEKGAYLFHFDDGQTRVEGYFPELHLSKCVTHWMPMPEAPRKED